MQLVMAASTSRRARARRSEFARGPCRQGPRTRDARPAGPGRAGDGGCDRAQVEVDHLGERGLGISCGPQHALCAQERLDERDVFARTAGAAEVVQRPFVGREEADGRAVLRRHVGDRRPVGDRQRGHAWPAELQEPLNQAVLVQHLGQVQRQVGGENALGELAHQPEADHLGDAHRGRFTEHGCRGLDTADAPAEHRQRVDHGRMTVRAQNGVETGDLITVAIDRGRDHLGELLDIELVADTDPRRHDVEAGHVIPGPGEEPIAVMVPFVLAPDVEDGDTPRSPVVGLDPCGRRSSPWAVAVSPQ